VPLEQRIRLLGVRASGLISLADAAVSDEPVQTVLPL
jgi:hypothetical protein